MRHCSHQHRTVVGAALVWLGAGVGSAEKVPAAVKPLAPGWLL